MGEHQLKEREIMAFALPNAVSAMVHTIPVMYGMMFMTEYLGISAAAMGTAMLVTKLMDYVVAIFAGGVIEKARSKKHGKYAFWMRITTFTLFFGSLFQMVDTSPIIPSPIGRLIFVSIFYCALHFGMNFRATSTGGILQRMGGSSMEARARLNARQAQSAAAVTIISGAVTIPSIEFFAQRFGPSNGYAITLSIFGAFFLGLSFFMLFPIMKKYDLPRDTVEVSKAPTIGDMFKSIVTNTQMIVVFIMITSMTVGTQIYTPLIAYYFNVVTGQFSAMTLLLTIQGVVSFAFSLIAPSIAKRLGKKGALIFSSGLSILSYLGIWAFGLKSPWALIVFACLIKGSESIYRCFSTNYFLDCGEYGYYMTGQDNRTMALTVMNWPIKIGFLVGGSAVGYGLAAIGYTAGMEVTQAFANKFMVLFGLVPAGLVLVTFILAIFAYKLTDEQAAFYATENAKREAALREQTQVS